MVADKGRYQGIERKGLATGTADVTIKGVGIADDPYFGFIAIWTKYLPKVGSECPRNPYAAWIETHAV
jgi:hypothetical protein